MRGGVALSGDEAAKFASYLMIFFGRLDAEKGWTKQLHLGAYRNAIARMLNGHGRDMGFDSIGDWRQVEALAQYLDRLDRGVRFRKRSFTMRTRRTITRLQP